jgi:hypothetical protein
MTKSCTLESIVKNAQTWGPEQLIAYIEGDMGKKIAEIQAKHNVQGVQKSINSRVNTTLLSWTGITSVSGVITISAISSNQGATASSAYINVIEIIETLE